MRTQFRDAEEAWFWYVAGRDLVNEGARPEGPGLRPVTLVDIDRALIHLYRRKEIGDAHLVVGTRYAREGRPPAADYPTEQHDAILWRELMDALRPYLRRYGAVE